MIRWLCDATRPILAFSMAKFRQAQGLIASTIAAAIVREAFDHYIDLGYILTSTT